MQYDGGGVDAGSWWVDFASAAAPSVCVELPVVLTPALVVRAGSGKSSLLRLMHGDRRYLRGMSGDIFVNGTKLRAVYDVFK
jgi:ABC-type transport system involved in cytochrome bd biosynthesis fused ATPase/permease subunit